MSISSSYYAVSRQQGEKISKQTFTLLKSGAKKLSSSSDAPRLVPQNNLATVSPLTFCSSFLCRTATKKPPISCRCGYILILLNHISTQDRLSHDKLPSIQVQTSCVRWRPVRLSHLNLVLLVFCIIVL